MMGSEWIYVREYELILQDGIVLISFPFSDLQGSKLPSYPEETFRLSEVEEKFIMNARFVRAFRLRRKDDHLLQQSDEERTIFTKLKETFPL